MNLASVREVLLARSFETADGPARLLSEREWADCTRAGLAAPAAQVSFTAFLGARAAAACALLARREPALAVLPAAAGGLAWLAPLLTGLGFLVGLGTNLFNGSDRFNLFAPGVLGVLAWNLALYGLLLRRAWPRPQPAPPRVSGGVQRLADWLGARAITSRLPARATALLGFVQDWQQASRPLLGARLAAVLHFAGAALALGMVLGMYGRGLVAEYRVIWGSTFVGAAEAHAWLSGVLGPAAMLTGIPIPDAQLLDALRHDAQLPAATTSAGPWIHLYAVMLGLVVVLPRALLGGIGRWRVAQLERDFPLALADGYFAALARVHAASLRRASSPPAAQIALDVQTCTQPLSPAAAAGLKALLDAAVGDAAILTLRAGVPEEDATATSVANATHRLVICDLTRTPEADTHGPLLRGDGRLPVSLVLDETAFRERFGEGSARLAERRASWQRFAASLGIGVLCLPLAASDPDAHAPALRKLLGLDAATSP